MIDRETFLRTLEPALLHGPHTHDVKDWLQGVVEGRFQMWSTTRSALITEMISFPQCKVIRAVATAGDLSEVKGLITAAEKWGREQGCTHAWGGGRPGWERTLIAEGYTRSCVLLEKDLRNA